MNIQRWLISSLALVLAGVLWVSAPARAQPWGGGPRWQTTQSDQTGPGPGPGYRNCANYPSYQYCPRGTTPQGPRGLRGGGRYPQPNPPATPAVSQ